MLLNLIRQQKQRPICKKSCFNIQKSPVLGAPSNLEKLTSERISTGTYEWIKNCTAYSTPSTDAYLLEEQSWTRTIPSWFETTEH